MTVEEEDAAHKEICASIPEYEPTDEELQQIEDEFGAILPFIDHLEDKSTPETQAGVDFEQTRTLVNEVPTVEHTSISTVRASTPLYVQNTTQNVLFGLMVYGEGCHLWVYNTGLWDSGNWTCVLQDKTNPSLGNERRFMMEVCDGKSTTSGCSLTNVSPPKHKSNFNSGNQNYPCNKFHATPPCLIGIYHRNQYAHIKKHPTNTPQINA